MNLDKNDCLGWCFGNLLNNTTRGKLGEYIVAHALGVLDSETQDWDAYDLIYKGLKVEVKTSAYLQAWYQKKLSKIQFDVKPRKELWDAKTNEYTKLEPPRRVADIYVFCVLTEKNPDEVDPLNTNQWSFYIVKTDLLNVRFGNQKQLGIKRLQEVAPRITYEELKREFDASVQ